MKESVAMHDIGKLAISDSILLKPGKLTSAEWEEMKLHTEYGAKMLADGNSAIIKMAETVAISHHEKWDGTGYPFGLKGQEIPIYGRICAIADVFHALISRRPYKEAWTVKDATDEIVRTKDSHFDPEIVKAFLMILPEIRRSYDLKKSISSINK